MTARLTAAAVVAVVAVGAASACNFGFQTASIVVDLRILAASASPPEVVIDLDPAHPEAAAAALAANPFTVTALIADPGESRRLAWDMTACPPTKGRRCDAADPQEAAGSGVMEATTPGFVPAPPTATFAPSVALVQAAVSADSLAGFGGIAISVQIRVWPEGHPEQAIYAAKNILVSPRLPAERVANTNPTILGLGEGPDATTPTIGPTSCSLMEVSKQISPGMELDLMPIEPEGVREHYVLPTYNGGEHAFTETLTYDWYATGGDWSREHSGGPRTLRGRPDLDSTWTAPATTGDYSLWLVQRDERGGETFTEYCVRVQ